MADDVDEGTGNGISSNAEAKSVKGDEYRDVLELWCIWWDGPGRRSYAGNILPPLKRTREVMSCVVCAGVDIEEGRCEVCGRAGAGKEPRP